MGSVVAGFTPFLLVGSGFTPCFWWGLWWLGSPHVLVGSVVAGFTPCFSGVCGAPLFSFLCCVFCFVSLRPMSVYPTLPLSYVCVPYVTSVLCLCTLRYLCPMSVYALLPVSMNCPFLIAPPVFSNVYLYVKKNIGIFRLALEFRNTKYSCTKVKIR